MKLHANTSKSPCISQNPAVYKTLPKFSFPRGLQFKAVCGQRRSNAKVPGRN